MMKQVMTIFAFFFSAACMCASTQSITEGSGSVGGAGPYRVAKASVKGGAHRSTKSSTSDGSEDATDHVDVDHPTRRIKDASEAVADHPPVVIVDHPTRKIKDASEAVADHPPVVIVNPPTIKTKPLKRDAVNEKTPHVSVDVDASPPAE